MAKAVKTIGIVLGSVALIATGFGAALGAAGMIAGISGATLATVGTIASVASGIASIGAAALQQSERPPPVRGSVTQIIVDPNAPQPYVMGEGLFAGVLRHDTAYGGTVSDVPNPYRFWPVVYSGGGPVQSIEPRVDFGEIPSWYAGYLYTDTQLGACPEASALAPHWSGATGWSAAHKLSGQAAIGWSFKFDPTGQKYTSGMPPTAAYGQWVKVYDPRQDDTFPGGEGPCRLGDEDTYVWDGPPGSTIPAGLLPALHAGMYAFGRYQNDQHTMGIGMPADGVDWEAIAAWANVCEANSWTMFGVVFEPGDQWQNLVDICHAGGGRPIPGAGIGFRYHAPAVVLDEITEADLADDPSSVIGSQTYRDRINTAIPTYLSPDHNWQMVQAEPIAVSTYVDADKETKQAEWPFNFVTNATQATQIAAYKLLDSRELPIELVCKPRVRGYRPGDCVQLTLPSLSLNHKAIIQTRQLDPQKMTVTLTLITETDGKHDFALGRTGTPPEPPALTQSPQDRDETVGNNIGGASGSPAYGASLTNEAHSVTCDSDGNVLSYAGAEGALLVFLGQDEITGDCTFAIAPSGNPEGLTGPFGGSPVDTATGAFNVTGGYDSDEDNASLKIRATHTATGATLDKTFSLSKSIAGNSADLELAALMAASAQHTLDIAASQAEIAALLETYGSTDAAAVSASAAAAAASAAAMARDQAVAARTAAEGAEDAALAAALASSGSASAAAGSASAAASEADEAAGHASAASGSATAAQTAQSAAAASQSAAATSATNAAGSASSAATQATNSATSATNASNSASAASGSASTAATQATNAGNSASAANTSATNAASSAGSSSTSAGQASTSATNAAGSASTATTQAGLAASSASAAAGSASAASTSASNANTSATNAGISATSATTSANAASGAAGNASSSASSASSSAASASGSASAAQQAATISASVNTGALNKSPMFSDNQFATGAPTNWNAFDVNTPAPATVTRVAGLNGVGYATRLTAGAGLNSYMGQSVGPCTAGDWFVIEGDFTLNAGTFAGAGFYYSIGSLHIPDAKEPGAVAPIGNGTIGRTYRVRQLFQSPLTATVTMYFMNHWSGFMALSGTPANDITWHRVAIRAATQSEVDAGRVASIEATVGTQASVLASLNSTYASLASTVTTQGVTITQQSTAITGIQGNQTTLFGRAALRVDVNGRWVGYEINNNGIVGSVDIHADQLTISKPGGGSRTEFGAGNWRVYFPSGALAGRFGVWA